MLDILYLHSESNSRTNDCPSRSKFSSFSLSALLIVRLQHLQMECPILSAKDGTLILAAAFLEPFSYLATTSTAYTTVSKPSGFRNDSWFASGFPAFSLSCIKSCAICHMCCDTSRYFEIACPLDKSSPKERIRLSFRAIGALSSSRLILHRTWESVVWEH